MNEQEHKINERFYAISKSRFQERDRWIALHVQSKPWWLPKLIWDAMLRRLLVQAEFKTEFLQP